jgi:hypothetical protein
VGEGVAVGVAVRLLVYVGLGVFEEVNVGVIVALFVGVADGDRVGT